jgi:hypothetical protein
LAPAGYTTVSASNITNASGKLIATATIYFAPVTDAGAPVSFRVNGSGRTITRRVSAPVINGAFSIVLADTTLTDPVDIGYSVTLVDGVTGDQLFGPGYECFQPSGDAVNFDAFEPML